MLFSFLILDHPNRSQDVELMCRLLEGVSLEDSEAVEAVARRFHKQRTAHAATINILANALYQVKREIVMSYVTVDVSRLMIEWARLHA